MGLVERRDDRLEDVANVGADIHQRELGAVAGGQGAGQIGFVGGRRPGARIASRERVGRVPRDRHARGHRGGVQPAAQEHGHRHVAHEMRRHRAVEPLAHARLGVARAGRAVQREVPVATGGDVSLPLPHDKLRLAHPRTRYTVGFYRRGETVMHVSPGLGTTFVPFRFYARPEATELVLQPTR